MYIALHIVAFLTLVTKWSLALRCESIRGRGCLGVYNHRPTNQPKCYCTDLCKEPLEKLRFSCSSGQLHEDPCGHCLVCAKSLGQSCGGAFNFLGICASDLVCLTWVSPAITNTKDRKAAEQQATGVCVSKRDSRCPRSGSSSNNRSMNCRPGKLGIIADALYCPTGLRQPSRRARNPRPLMTDFLFE